MVVYVDEMRIWGPTGLACFAKGSCHLTADSEDELTAFARRLGLKDEWFQDTRVPHYDLTPARRRSALEYGAVFVPARAQARKRMAADKKLKALLRLPEVWEGLAPPPREPSEETAPVRPVVELEDE